MPTHVNPKEILYRNTVLSLENDINMVTMLIMRKEEGIKNNLKYLLILIFAMKTITAAMKKIIAICRYIFSKIIAIANSTMANINFLMGLAFDRLFE